jgi:hypothetical protein
MLRAPNQFIYFVCVFFALLVSHFVHNVDATASYDRKELLDIRTVITHAKLDKYLYLMRLTGRI